MSFDLFEFYRFLLAALLCIYGTIKLVSFIWQWQGFAAEGRGGVTLAARYLLILLLRLRFRRFALDLIEVSGLVAILAVLLRLHWW